MAFLFIKDTDINPDWFINHNQDYEDLNVLMACSTHKHVVYGYTNDIAIQGLIFVEISAEVVVRKLIAFDDNCCTKLRLINYVKMKYKNKDIMMDGNVEMLKKIGFEFTDKGSIYIRKNHQEDTFLNMEGQVEKYPVKLSDKNIVLTYVSRFFEFDKEYTESEINQIIQQRVEFEDYVTMRRDLFDFGFLERSADGATYWKV
ncbi:MAG: DUF2087 domain-containing protein [Turicibacter sp.]